MIWQVQSLSIEGATMKTLLFFIAFLIFSSPLFAQDSNLRGLKTVISKLEGETSIIGRQYAVLIAIDKYQAWTALRNPVEDAKQIKEILSRRYLLTDFIELYDEAATKAGIIKLFKALISDTKPEDSVLIYYAGHGFLDKTSDTGFWIPVDGGIDVNEQANWLPNAQVRGFISNMKARHIALLADSCFSGDFLNPTRGITPTITEEYFKNAYARVSRQVLTSGSSEAVPDESQFTFQLKIALEGNTSPFLDPLMLYNQMRFGITQTTPLIGDLKDSGHQDGSSFILFLKSDNIQAEAGRAISSSEDSSAISFELEKVSGVLNIKTKAAGVLFLDGAIQGKIPAGRVATIRNLAEGTHDLQMKYENDKTESLSIRIDSNEPVSVEFSSASAPLQPPSNVLLLQLASITIDGNFNDWNTIQPAFSRVASSSSGVSPAFAINKVFLAKDAKNLYMRFDIMDSTPASLFHPQNFDMGHNSSYGVDFQNGDVHVIAHITVLYDPNVHRWRAEIGRFDDKWSYVDTDSGQYAMKGSSLEASFPLALIQGTLGPLSSSGYHAVSARSGYIDGDWHWDISSKRFILDNWRWVQNYGDATETERVKF
jgi:Caspase domain